MSARIIAIGDIHGHAKALFGLVRLLDLRPEDTLVTLGDYVDRGPDSKGVLDQLIELESRCHLVPLMGNHEEMMLGASMGRSDFGFWMTFGGDAALKSYGLDMDLTPIPSEHWAFLNRLPLLFETDHHFFVHANYYPNRPIREQDSQTALWRSLEANDIPGRHYSGKTAILGHSQQEQGRILDLAHLKCIDTGCGHGGCLTALDVNAGQVWQVNEDGFPMDGTVGRWPQRHGCHIGTQR